MTSETGRPGPEKTCRRLAQRPLWEPQETGVGANSFAKQAEGVPWVSLGTATRSLANEFAPTRGCSLRINVEN
ncbi:hypothetical protein E8E95_27855 [Pseudomonas sp. BN414]|nr:hypothetical protein [Pseudomonas sp. BN414]